MGWLDALERRAREATGIAPIAPVRATPTRAKPEVKSIWVQTAAPIGPGDPGAAEPAFYFVSDGVLDLCDEQGKPSGKSVALGSNDDPRRIAGRLKLEAWQKEQGTGNFNRRFHYSHSGIV
ncbi:hypothetical protein V1279_003363 [Bradyrhizobium sp. AZCC 1610]|uniref:hypothetical protein n=1 Tax=Bradyrhizobium sp. AZCC 1610 TaxID=3117020 RepID=UPI002FEF5282